MLRMFAEPKIQASSLCATVVEGVAARRCRDISTDHRKSVESRSEGETSGMEEDEGGFSRRIGRKRGRG
jgi:hypothetical protein